MRRTAPVGRPEGIDAQGGLTTSLAAERTRLCGSSDIVETPPSTWRELARDTLRDPMKWFLLGAVPGDLIEVRGGESLPVVIRTDNGITK